MTDLEKIIVIYALRYSLGRMTGAPDDVQQYIVNNIEEFREWEIKAIIKEIEEASSLGMECDVVGWNIFKEKLVDKLK